MTREEAARRLDELLRTLHHCEGELADAEREGLALIAESYRREIEKRHDLIRRHCELTGLPSPHGVPKAASLDPRSQTKLRELLSKLFEYRHELEAAELRGDDIIAKTARQLIRTQHRVIRDYCRAVGLPVPPDVPLKD